MSTKRIWALFLSLLSLRHVIAQITYCEAVGREQCECWSKSSEKCSSQLAYPSESISCDFKCQSVIIIKKITNGSILPQGEVIEIGTLSLTNNSIEMIEQSALIKFAKIFALEISSNKLSNLDFLIPLCDLISVDVGKNLITFIDARWFNCMTSLQWLVLEFNRIRDIEGSPFLNLRNLISLYLSGNRLENIQTETFTGLTSVECLNLENNQLITIQSFAFNDCKMIKNECNGKSLGFKNQNIESLFAYSFWGLVEYETLDLSQNRISYLRNLTFAGLENLKTLDFEDNFLQFIETDGFDVSLSKSLESLNLADNLLTQINKTTFSNLKRLSYLYLQVNQINKIEPYSFAMMNQSLLEINLSFNKLGYIKNSYFYNLIKLTRLDLSYNQISAIEPGSFKLTNQLRTLNIRHNCIYKIDDYLLRSLSLLEQFYADNNLITRLQSSIFSGISKLEALNLSNNQIERIENNVFRNLTRLKTLDLSYNRLSILDNSFITFKDLSALKFLNLSHNLLSELSMNHLYDSQFSLQSLSLDSNQLRSLSLTGIRYFSNLNIIDLSGNAHFVSASQLMGILTKSCYSCYYELTLRSMSPEFIKNFIRYLIETNIRSISKLDLSYNDLADLIDYIPFSSSLDRLFLRNINIQTLPFSLKDLSKLYELDLSDNFVYFAGHFSENSNLRILYAANTRIKSIQRDLNLSIFPSIKKLDLSRNEIEVIRTVDFNNRDQLIWLNLSHNKIRFIEDLSFQGIPLSNFVYFDMSYNYLSQLQEDLFYYSIDFTLGDVRLNNNKLVEIWLPMNSPVYLDLDDNLLTSISDFKQTGFSIAYLEINRNNLTEIKKGDMPFKFLKRLGLSGNQIFKIQDESFLVCEYLADMDLSINMIGGINSSVFRGLTSLSKLNLSFNSIEYLAQDMFTHLGSLLTVDLNQNRIKFIQDNLFVNLIYAREIRLDSLELINITELTFHGLQSIRDLQISPMQFDATQNVNHTISSLSRSYKIKNELYSWYESINIAFNKSLIDSRYCSLAIYFARNNFLVNLKTDSKMAKYMTACRLSLLADLEYTKFGFN